MRLKKDANLPERLAAEALALRAQGAEVVGIICNRVARARAVFERLRLQGDALLLTGRIRPHDKDALTAEALPRMAVQTRGRRAPLFVVATQTIEVGADLDLDAMVTDCAPLSALRQRAGRLDRLGELERAPLVILYQPGERKTDPVYGEDLDAAWKWLESVASGRPKQVDFGIAALDALIASKPPPAGRRPEAPSLLPAHLDLLAQTSVPHGIEIAPWLHGWETGPADVYLCWRADSGADLAEAARAVEAAPPVQRELLAVPLYALRHWSAEIADLEGADPRDQTRPSGKHCIRWNGETAEPIRHDQARPGDTLILPSRAGGCDRFGWYPDSTAPVTDVGDDGRRVRLHPALRPELAAEIRQLLDRDDASAADWRDLARRTAALDGEPGQVRRYPGGCVVLRAAEWTSRSALRPVALAVHQSAVAERAADFARLSGLAPDLIETLRKAGAGHDAGKADPRWQAMVGGDGTQVLAKGPGGDDPWLALPTGWRHEMASALLQKDGLARYLVGSHHGHGRPLLPAAPDPELWRRLGDWPVLWRDLQRSHGHWGLAYLEALIRLADWTVSEEEQR